MASGSSASKKDGINRNLRSVLITEKAGVPLNRLQGEFQTLLGETIPFREFGFPSLEAYLKSIPSVVSLRWGPTGEMMCSAVADETTKHIASLVSRQKGKKTKGRGLRSKPGRFYAHPTYATCMSKARPAGKIYTSRFMPKTGKYNTSFKPAAMQQSKYNHLSKPASIQQPKTVKHNNLVRPKETTRLPTAMHTQQLRPTAAQQSRSTVTQQPRAAGEDTQRLVHVPTATQLPNPGPWSGKLGSKRGQPPAKTTTVGETRSSTWKPVDDLNSTNDLPSKPIHENIHVTIPNDGARQVNSQTFKPVQDNIHVIVSNNGHRQTETSPQKPKGKARTGKANKPEWSSNFEVPPRFKKLVSPTGTTAEGFQKTPESSSNSDPSPSGTVSQPSSTPTNNVVTEVATETFSWIQTVLSKKPNGLWASALCDMHQKEFGQPLDTKIIEQMNKLSLLEKESISNSDILYPKQTVATTVSSASKTNERSGALKDLKEKNNAEHGNQTENGNAQSSPRLPEEDTPSEGYSSPTLGAPSSLSEPSSRPPSTEAPNSRPPSSETPSTLDEPCEEGYSSPTSETQSEPSYEGGNLSTIDASGMPSLVLPEENKWDLYVAYIKSLSDFYAILIGDDYSEQLIIMEEAMRSFYQCSTWVLTEPPEAGVCYAAEFNREWLRVQVLTVEDDQVQCFLLDHGDIENAAISSLRPLAEKFLQLPFQVIHCKISQYEQVAHDDKTALQMFCQLALGKNLLAEVVSRDGDQIEMELFDSSDVSILEQCMAAGI